MFQQNEACSVFSADGTLLQVKYAMEAVTLSSPVVGVCGKDVVVMAAEKRKMPALFDTRTDRKIFKLDKHLALGFTGLRADARVLINRAQAGCRIHQLSMAEPSTAAEITTYVAFIKQLFTQRPGCRPFGVSCLIGGVEADGSTSLYQTEPSGVFTQWKATAIGRNSTGMFKYLEKEYKPNVVATECGALNLALSALLTKEGYDSSKKYEVAIVRKEATTFLDSCEVAQLVSQIDIQK